MTPLPPQVCHLGICCSRYLPLCPPSGTLVQPEAAHRTSAVTSKLMVGDGGERIVDGLR